MKIRVAIILFALVAQIAVAAITAQPPATITTTTGRAYTNATIIRQEGRSVTVHHDGGIATVPIDELSSESKARYGLSELPPAPDAKRPEVAEAESTGAQHSQGDKSEQIDPLPAERTKEQWWQKFKQDDLCYRVGYEGQAGAGPKGFCTKEEFFRVMGKPDKTQKIGGQVFWYYDCSDGQIQMILMAGNLEPEYGGNVVCDDPESVNDY